MSQSELDVLFSHTLAPTLNTPPRGVYPYLAMAQWANH